MVLVIHRTLPDLSGWQHTDPADLGVLGNDVLKRLNMVADNRLGAVYLRPSRRATDTFRHPERLLCAPSPLRPSSGSPWCRIAECGDDAPRRPEMSLAPGVARPPVAGRTGRTLSHPSCLSGRV
jgi:hypothetical protein